MGTLYLIIFELPFLQNTSLTYMSGLSVVQLIYIDKFTTLIRYFFKKNNDHLEHF